MVKVTGATGRPAVLPVGMETRSGRAPVATLAPPQSPEPATCQTAPVRVAATPLAQNENSFILVENAGAHMLI